MHRHARHFTDDKSRSLRCVGPALAALLLAGCVAAEPRFTVHDLPPDLVARHWEAPSSRADLSVAKAPRPVEAIEPGDTVEVMISTGLKPADVTRISTVVAADGTVALPAVGRVAVAGSPAESAGEAVIQACHETGIKKAPVVQVTLQQPRKNRITVNGAVEHPGVYLLSRDTSDVATALAEAGGLREDASDGVSIRKGTASPSTGDAEPNEVQHADFKQTANAATRREIILSSGLDESTAALEDGDVVFVERRALPHIQVTGAVKNPGRYAFPIGEEFGALDAVLKAGGTLNPLADTVVVCRKVRGESKKALIEVSLKKASRDKDENLRLAPDDVISVEPKPGELREDQRADATSIPLAIALGMAIR